MWGSGLTHQMKMKKPKKAMQNEQRNALWGTAYSRAAEYGREALLILHVLTNSGWHNVLQRRDSKD